MGELCKRGGGGRVAYEIQRICRSGGMEDGGMEGWRDGGMEGWRDRGMEGWRRVVDFFVELFCEMQA